MTDSTEAMREEFEAISRPGGYDFSYNNFGDYMSLATSYRWYGFKAGFEAARTITPEELEKAVTAIEAEACDENDARDFAKAAAQAFGLTVKGEV